MILVDKKFYLEYHVSLSSNCINLLDEVSHHNPLSFPHSITADQVSIKQAIVKEFNCIMAPIIVKVIFKKQDSSLLIKHFTLVFDQKDLKQLFHRSYRKGFYSIVENQLIN